MEFEKNRKYFTIKNVITTWVIPLAIILIGAILALILRRTLKMVALVIIVVGAVWLIAALTTGMKDDDIDAAVAALSSDLEAHSSEHFKFPRRYEVLHQNIILGGYDFTREEETPVKRGGDLKFRNGFYCSVLFNFTNDGLRIDSRKFSILEDKKDEELLHFKWEEVEGASLEEKEVTVKTIKGETANLKLDILHVKLLDGRDYAYCIKNTADVDETIDIIYRQTVRVKQEALKAKMDAQAEGNA